MHQSPFLITSSLPTRRFSTSTEEPNPTQIPRGGGSTAMSGTEGIEHKTVRVNGISMHIAEKGQGPVVLLLHGFPELWYTWRHQIPFLSSCGYRAVAPDLRGYGGTDSPGSSPSSYTCFHVVGDIVALIDTLTGGDDREKVFLVGHDWGAIIGWYLCLFRPEKVRAFVCLGVPYMPRKSKIRPLDGMRVLFGEDYYICRFQEPGKIEAEIDRYGAKNVLKKILTDGKRGPPCLNKENAFGIDPEKESPLPFWLSDEDLCYVAAKYEQTGFTGALNYYRALDLNWELTGPWTGAKVKVPVKFVVGELDMVYTTPGVDKYIHGAEDGFKRDVPMLEEVVVMEGLGHFINQEAPEEINNHILSFISTL